jgi:hypothetical protein
MLIMYFVKNALSNSVLLANPDRPIVPKFTIITTYHYSPGRTLRSNNSPTIVLLLLGDRVSVFAHAALA